MQNYGLIQGLIHPKAHVVICVSKAMHIGIPGIVRNGDILMVGWRVWHFLSMQHYYLYEVCSHPI